MTALDVMPAWEVAERWRLHRARCLECQALPPNHRHGCTRIRVPDPGAERCSCGYVKGSLGCRLKCGPVALDDLPDLAETGAGRG